MSETQRRVTGSFSATDDEGNHYTVTEYTKFDHTTTLETAEGEESRGVKEYEIGAGSPVRRLNELEFEILVNGTRIRRAA
jgi:hypothetical protein